jgi:hypothetical protein
MANFSQVLRSFLLVFVVVATTSNCNAFTPDAAFKMKNAMMQGTPGAGSNGDKANTPTYIIGNDRNMQLSLLSHEHSRKSITTPPSFEDYMELRRRSLLRKMLNKD